MAQGQLPLFGNCPSLTASSLPALSGVADAKEWGKFDAKKVGSSLVVRALSMCVVSAGRQWLCCWGTPSGRCADQALGAAWCGHLAWQRLGELLAWHLRALFVPPWYALQLGSRHRQASAEVARPDSGGRHATRAFLYYPDQETSSSCCMWLLWY